METTRISSLAQFSRQVAESLEAGEPDRALRLVSHMVLDVLSDQRATATVFSSKTLDELCQRIGHHVRSDSKYRQSAPRIAMRSRKKGKVTVYLVTELATAGGHSRALLDLIQADRTGEHIVMMTDLYGQVDHSAIAQMFGPFCSEILVARKGNYLDKLIWLQEQLRAIAPDRVYLLLHHFDSVSVAAIEPSLFNRTVFFHNCDHALCLGVHLDFAAHIDYHAKGYYNCIDSIGIENAICWPLVSADLGVPENRQFLKNTALTTCTSGGFEKFESPHHSIKLQYVYSYYDLLPTILTATGGKHIHIGRLSDASLAKIYQKLDDNWIDRSRFIHIPYVKSVWSAMHDLEVDVYIGSFPYGGGKAVVEVMGSGTPVVIHENYRSVFFTDTNEVYEEAWRWREPAQLIALLKELTPAELQRHGKLARAHYLAHHTLEKLSTAIRALETHAVTAPPPRPARRHLDQLQSYLDIRHADTQATSTSSGSDHTIRAQQATIQALQHEIAELKSSTSWRITGPLRRCVIMFRSIIRRSRRA